MSVKSNTYICVTVHTSPHLRHKQIELRVFIRSCIDSVETRAIGQNTCHTIFDRSGPTVHVVQRQLNFWKFHYFRNCDRSLRKFIAWGTIRRLHIVELIGI